MKKKLKCINTKKKLVRSPQNKLLIAQMKSNIDKNTDRLWLPKFALRFNDKETDSWFDHESFTRKSKINFKEKFKTTPKLGNFKKCIKVKLILNKIQKIIINNWLNACTVVYNKAVSLLRTGKITETRTKELFYTIRSQLTDYKNDIIVKKSLELLQNIPYIGNNFSDNHQVKVHILDKAIHEACKNYIANMTKLKKKQISHFNLKNLRFDRPNKILHLERGFFSENTFCNTALGKVIGKYNKQDFNFDDVNEIYKSECLLRFDNNSKEYYLYVPSNVDVTSEREKKSEHSKKMISIDPGIRTFITGITENSVEKICNNYIDKVKPLLKKETRYVNKKTDVNKRIERNRNKKVNKKKSNTSASKLKRERKRITNKLNFIRKKITNTIDDMQWKTIDYLTKNHENIFIGNLSTKDIVNNKTSNLNSLMKKLSLRTNMYKFRERLEYKCKIRGVNYEMIKENYTSKMCSYCGTINEKLASKKVFKCAKCKISIDRDVNGARNIYLKRYIKK